MQNKIRLFLFPFAGGSTYSFSAWKTAFPEWIELVPLELPGRGGRFGTPLVRTMAAAVEDYFEQVKGQLDGPFAFFGHSMGAMAAFLLVMRLKEAGLPLPVHLFASGRASLNTAASEKLLHALPSSKMWQALANLGGLPDEVLGSPDLLSLFEPVLRADLTVVETCPVVEASPQPVPISVLLGKNDRNTSGIAVGWGELSEFPASVHWLSGDHFFIYGELESVKEVICAALGE